MVTLGGKLRCKKPRAWKDLITILSDGWVIKNDSGEVIEDLGKPMEWGSDVVLVLDSLSRIADAAYYHELMLQNALLQDRNARENQRDIGATQSRILDLMRMLSDKAFGCNICLIGHIKRATEYGHNPASEEAKDASVDVFGFPAAIGSAILPVIPQFFSTILHAKIEGTKQYIYAKTTGEVATKNTNPFGVGIKYPLETGLADYFKALRQ